MYQYRLATTYLQRIIIVLSCMFSLELAQGMQNSADPFAPVFEPGEYSPRAYYTASQFVSTIVSTIEDFCFTGSTPSQRFGWCAIDLREDEGMPSTTLFRRSYVENGLERFISQLFGGVRVEVPLHFGCVPVRAGLQFGSSSTSIAPYTWRQIFDLGRPSSPPPPELQTKQQSGAPLLSLGYSSSPSPQLRVPLDLGDRYVFFVRHGRTFGDDFIKGPYDALILISVDGKYFGKIRLNLEDDQDLALSTAIWKHQTLRTTGQMIDPLLGRSFLDSVTGPFSIFLELNHPFPPGTLPYMLKEKLSDGYPQLLKAGQETTLEFIPFSLTKEGFESIRNTAQEVFSFLRKIKLCPVIIFYSPRYRTEQTARTLASGLRSMGVDVELVKRQELDDAPLKVAGMTKEEVFKAHPELATAYSKNPGRFLEGDEFGNLVEGDSKFARIWQERFYKQSKALFLTSYPVVIGVSHDILTSTIMSWFVGGGSAATGGLNGFLIPSPKVVVVNGKKTKRTRETPLSGSRSRPHLSDLRPQELLQGAPLQRSKSGDVRAVRLMQERRF